MKLMTLTLAPVLLMTLCASLHTQEDPQAARDQNQAQAPANPRVFDAEQLKTFYFTPQHTNIRDLEHLAHELYARELYINDRGGIFSHPVENLMRLGETIVIYDTPEYAKMLGAALHEMDVAMKGETSAQPEQSTPTTVITNWSPKHIGLNDAVAALQSFRRNTMVYDEYGHRSDVQNFSVVNELNELVLRDTPLQIEAMVNTLNKLDVPEQQLFITCLVISGNRMAPEGNESKSELPQELVQNLSKLVPFAHFELQSMGILRASAMAGNLEMLMDDNDSLSLREPSYDSESRSLTAVFKFSSNRSNQRFQTRTTIRAGEYTVIGATGNSPLFAVLKIEPID